MKIKLLACKKGYKEESLLELRELDIIMFDSIGLP